MILMIFSICFTILSGVAFGCMVIEMTLRAMVYCLTDHPAKGAGRPRSDSQPRSDSHGVEPVWVGK